MFTRSIYFNVNYLRGFLASFCFIIVEKIVVTCYNFSYEVGVSMKKLKAFVFALLLFFLSTNSVFAVCDATESNTLNSLAANVRASYEIVQLESDEDVSFPDGITEEEADDFVFYRRYFRIHINNITEELYVVVTNETTDESTTYTYADAVDGTITIDALVTTQIMNYTIEIYSSSATNCANTKLYTTYLTTPKSNPYSSNAMCEGIEEFYLCHEYLSVDTDYSYYDLVEMMASYRDGHIDEDGDEIVEEPVEEETGFGDFLKENIAVVIIVVVVIIAAGGLITFVVIKKQRSKVV